MPKTQAAKPAPAATDETRGHCMCGAIAYAFTGKPLWVAHCHCESCRRATSAAFATYVGVDLGQFTYLEGEPTYYESSPGAKRYFCAKCGSSLAFVSDKWPGEIHLYAGSLANPAAIEPRGHVQTAEQLPWAEVHDDLPRFERFGKGATPVRKGPKKG